MKYIYIVFVFFLTNFGLKAGPVLSISEVDTSAYPWLNVSFSVFDDDYYLVRDLVPADFQIMENKELIPETDVIVDCEDGDAPLNIVLVLDQSTSMDSIVDGKSKWHWVIEGAKQFINYAGGRDSVFIAVTTFAGNSKINCNFTNNKNELYDSLQNAKVVTSITNFNNALMQPNTGAVELLKQRPYDERRIIIFLTDGQHSAKSDYLKIPDIIQTLLTHNIQMFSITFMSEINNDLIYISESSGGKNYNIKSVNALNEIYIEIANLILNKSICKLSWKSGIICHDDNPLKLVEIDFLKLPIKTVNTSYIAPFSSMTFFNTDKQIYFFGNPEPNQSVQQDIILNAEINEEHITSFKIEPPQNFKIVSWGEYGSEFPETGITIPAGDTIVLTVEFTQNDVKTKRNSLLSIYGDPCDINIDLLGGLQQVDIFAPLETEVYSACENMLIQWRGIDDGTMVDLYFKAENDERWTLITDSLAEKSYLWSPPEISDKYYFKVEETQFNNTLFFKTYGNSGDEKVLSMILDSVSANLYVCGYFSEKLEFESTTLSSFGGTDAFLAKFDVYGNFLWAKSWGSVKDDIATSLAIDEFSNIYVVGNVKAAPTINNITRSLNNPDYEYMFVVAYDETGKFREHELIGSDDENTRFIPYPDEVGVFHRSPYSKVVINGKFLGNYYISDGGFIIGNPDITRPVDFTMYLNHNLRPNYVAKVRSSGIYSDTVITDKFGINYFAGYYNARDTLISGNYYSTNGLHDFYLHKFGSLPQSKDSTGLIEINKPQLEFLKNSIDFGGFLMGNELEIIETGILKNIGKVPVTIIETTFEGVNPGSFYLKSSLDSIIILPGQAIDVSFIFNPELFGNLNTVFRVRSDCGDDVSLYLFGKGTCGLESDSLLDLGTILVNDETSQTFTEVLYNPTSQGIPFTIAVRGRDFTEFEVSPKGNLLAPANSYFEFTVTFKPRKLGSKEAYLLFSPSNDCAYSRVDIIAEAVNPELRVDSLDFGRVRINSSNSGEININNLGLTDETITDIYFISNDDDSFTFNTPELPYSLASKSNLILDVNYNPKNEGLHSALIGIEIGESEMKYALLTGDAFLPILEVELICGKPVFYGDTSEVTVIVRNLSYSSDLRVREVQILNNDIEYFWTESQPRDLTISKDNTYQFFKVTYIPKEGEDQVLDINVIADNYDGTFLQEWKDNLYSNECPVPDFEYNNPIDFGSRMICYLDSLPLTITNNSIAYTMVIYANSVSIEGDSKKAFSVDMQKNLLLKPGESTTIYVQFNPEVAGTYNAKLLIETSHPQKDIEVDLLAEINQIRIYNNIDEITVLPNYSGIFPIYADIPEISEEYIENLKIKLRYDYELIGFTIDSISSPFSVDKTANEYAEWTITNDWNSKQLIINADCKIKTPYKGLLLELPFTGYLSSIDSSLITAELEYTCTSANFDLTLFQFGDICFENGRLVIFSPYNFDAPTLTPNPITNGKMHLDFSIGLTVHTEINLIDVQGRIVKQFICKELNAGEYSFDFDINDMNAGVYYLEFRTPIESSHQKVMIIK